MGPARGRSQAWAQGLGPHFLLNIWSQAHPNPSTSSLPAPGGRESGGLSSKNKQIMFLSCVNECRINKIIVFQAVIKTAASAASLGTKHL